MTTVRSLRGQTRLPKIAFARSVVEKIWQTQTDEAKIFFGLIAMQANVKSR